MSNVIDKDLGWKRIVRKMNFVDGKEIRAGVLPSAGKGKKGVPIAEYATYNEYGTKNNLALAFFVAHIIALNGVYATAQGPSTDGSVAGIKREKEGDLEREYAIPEASDYMSLLYKTYYGRMYLQIMKLCAIGSKTRFG